MISIELVQQALAEVGRALDVLQITRDADGTFRIRVDEQTEVLLELHESQEKLTFLTDVGQPSPERRLATYRAALQYNFLWHKTGGVRLSLDGPDGAVIQSYDWFPSLLSIPDFCTLIHNFSRKAQIWRRIMEAGGFDDGGLPEDSLTPLSEFDVEDALAV